MTKSHACDIIKKSKRGSVVKKNNAESGGRIGSRDPRQAQGPQFELHCDGNQSVATLVSRL